MIHCIHLLILLVSTRYMISMENITFSYPYNRTGTFANPNKKLNAQCNSFATLSQLIIEEKEKTYLYKAKPH